MDFLPGSCGPGIAWCVVYEILFAAVAGAVAVGLLALFIHLVYRVPTFRCQERKLHKLAELRESGVKLRNMRPPLALIRIRSIAPGGLNTWPTIWDEAAENWKLDLYKAAGKLSPVEEKRMRTIDWLSDRPHSGPFATVRQVLLLLELSATIERLDNMLQQRFRPRNSP